ncbi:PLP-dependent aminotransferase family protein [Inhella sp.]|uniref:MocR-like pyridoxine biosynthesis transcription factor PdxR n=1 Tax=Inhella sp. TaxID=1921806 RepID=UPI0035B48B62
MEPTHAPAAWLIDGAGLRLTRSDDRSLTQQLVEQLKTALQTAERGARLPPSRALAQALGVGRNTVLAAYERLADEGYIEGRAGAGTRLLQSQQAPPVPTRLAAAEPERWRQLPPPRRSQGPLRPFAMGLPPQDLFPGADWARLQRRLWRRCERGELPLGYGPAEGEPRLRAALAAWLRHARGLRCSPEQVLITSGAQQAFALLGLALPGPGEPVAVEAPGYHASWAALQLGGARPVGVPVDGQGLRPAALQALGPGCRMAVVTPSHQWPTGACMGLERRLALLEWAQRQRAWLVEDDYAGEYRFDGPPLPALSSLDREGRCIYVGSFSKLLLPGLRLGYLVLPPALVPLLQRVRAALDRQPPHFEQEVLADFIEQGLLARHLRRCRRAAAQRRQALLQAWARAFGPRWPLQAPASGLNVFLPLASPAEEARLLEQARAAGLMLGGIQELLRACGQPGARAGLVLGFGASTEAQLRAAVARLAQAWA